MRELGDERLIDELLADPLDVLGDELTRRADDDVEPRAGAVAGESGHDDVVGDVAEATLELLMGPTGRRVRPHGDTPDGATHRLITPQLVVRRSSHLAPVEEPALPQSGDHNGEKEQQ